MKVLVFLLSAALLITGCVNLRPHEIRELEEASEQSSEFEVFSPDEIIMRAYYEIDELHLTEKEFNTLSPRLTPEGYFQDWATSLGADAVIFEIYREQTGWAPGTAGGWFPKYEITYIGIAIAYE